MEDLRSFALDLEGFVLRKSSAFLRIKRGEICGGLQEKKKKENRREEPDKNTPEKREGEDDTDG